MWRCVINLAAAESIYSVVIVSLASRAVVLWVARCVESEVVSLPNRYRSIRFCGIGSMNGVCVASCGGVWVAAFSFVGLDVYDLG